MPRDLPMNKRLYKSIKDKVKQTKLLNRINDKRNAKKKQPTTKRRGGLSSGLKMLLIVCACVCVFCARAAFFYIYSYI